MGEAIDDDSQSEGTEVMGGRTGRGRRRFGDVHEFYEWLDSETAPRFDRKTCFEHGNWAALLDTVNSSLAESAQEKKPKRLAPTDPVSVPRWALEALKDQLLVPHLDVAKSATGKGRHARWKEQYRQDLVDWLRYHEVWIRHIARGEGDPPRPSRGVMREERRAFLASEQGTRDGVDLFFPHTWQAGQIHDDVDAFAAAATLKRKSAWGGSARAVRKSWERVTKALSRGESWRYYPSRWVRFKGHPRSTEQDSPR